ncbi:MAG: MotA/TolQ/ExbB proton channel family protein [bacterium]
MVLPRLKTISSRALFFILLSYWGLSNASAQPGYEIRIKDIKYLQLHKNWLLIPTYADLRLEWELLNRGQQTEDMDTRDASHVSAFTYQVYLYEENLESEPLVREVRGRHHTDYLKKRVGTKLIFKIRALASNSMLVAESAPATVVIGKPESGIIDASTSQRSLGYYLHPGRWQLLAVGKPEIYDQSTQLGKTAFMFLSISTMLSLLVLLFFSIRTLYLGNIFPYRRSKRNLLWSLSLSCDNSYHKRLTNKFKFILNAWEMIATTSRGVADNATKNIPTGLSATEKMATVDVACMEYWTLDGDKAISTITDIISFPDEERLNGRTKPDDLLAELVIKIEDCFHPLISKNGNEHTLQTPTSDMQELIDEIYEPVVNENKITSRIRRWVLRKGVFDMRKGLEPFPTSKIIQAGLEIHRMNGYRWLKPSEEVKRAFENRASIEIENLRRKSRIDWFWNYAALAPLIGLFGTVTGITFAFQELGQTAMTGNFMSTIHQLSNGIFEALWTTIFGIANGIVFLLVYYYFKYKLDWIYAKWEEIYITITEKL